MPPLLQGRLRRGVLLPRRVAPEVLLLGCCCLKRDANESHCPVIPTPPRPGRVMTVSEAAAEWDEFFYNKLKDQALSGLLSENGSPSYWYRTWPAIFNLADLGSPRVRQRAKMFIDLAFIARASRCKWVATGRGPRCAPRRMIWSTRQAWAAAQGTP